MNDGTLSSISPVHKIGRNLELFVILEYNSGVIIEYSKPTPPISYPPFSHSFL